MSFAPHSLATHTYLFSFHVKGSPFLKSAFYLGIACFGGKGVIAKIRPTRAKNGLRELKMDQKQTIGFCHEKVLDKGSTIQTKNFARREDLRFKPYV